MLMAAPADSGTPRTVGRLGSSYEVSYGTGDVLIIVDPRRTVGLHTLVGLYPIGFPGESVSV